MKTKSKSKILILDDDKAITEALEIALTVYGFEVKAIISHTKLLGLFEKFRPDLVILDYFLAGEEGTKMAAELRRSQKYGQLKIIMISAHPSAKADIDHKNIDAFVAKPFDLNSLVQKINSLLK